jgi:hypothetical protein
MSLLLGKLYSAPVTTITDILSQTTTTFFTPPTQTSTFYITSTPATSVRILTITAIPSTSIVVSVTVANINKGFGSKLPNFIANNAIRSSSK